MMGGCGCLVFLVKRKVCCINFNRLGLIMVFWGGRISMIMILFYNNYLRWELFMRFVVRLFF